MARVKSNVQAKKRHKKILTLTKGYQAGAKKLYRKAKEASLKAGAYAYAGRKQRKRDFRKLWITRLSAACKKYDINYNQFIFGLKAKNIELDRKILSEIAVNNPQIFEKLIEVIKK